MPKRSRTQKKIKGNAWFVLHHGVYHPEKTNKIRIVFDCSAKFRGVCINDNLLQGPDITNTLVGVLVRFRQERIPIRSDIQSMFHQIRISAEDRDWFRFFWWKNGNTESPLREYRVAVYLFGTMCSPSCANFALKTTGGEHKEEFSFRAVDVVNNCFYVDDCLAFVSTVDEAKTLVTRAV